MGCFPFQALLQPTLHSQIILSISEFPSIRMDMRGKRAHLRRSALLEGVVTTNMLGTNSEVTGQATWALH